MRFFKSNYSFFLLFFLCLASVCLNAAGQARSRAEHLLDRLKSGNVETRASAITEFFAQQVESGDNDREFAALVALGFALQHDESTIVRALAARALEFAQDPRAAEPMLSALRTERAIAVRKAILYGLVKYPTPPVVNELLQQLDHKDPENRAIAAFVLAEINDPTTVEGAANFLRRNKKDEDAAACVYLIRFLGQQQARSEFDLLLKAMKPDNPSELRRAAGIALGKIATPTDLKALEQLRQARLDKDPYLSSIAEAALSQVTDNQ